MPEWRDVIALKKKTFLFKKGRQIFTEGEGVNGLFFIYSGAVKVYKQWGDQKQLILRFARAGDILGHRGWGDTHTYPVSAVALEDTKACFITDEFLEATIKTNPAFTYRLLHFFATELQRAEKRMRDLAHMDVKGRIAGALLELFTVFGVDAHQYITTAVSRQDIASYAGTTYETVFKFFNELKKAKVISTRGKHIKINKEKKLQSLVSNGNGG